MGVLDILSLLKIKDGISIGGIIVVVILSLIQVSKININPWDRIFHWLGKKLFSSFSDRMDALEEKLDKHIEESTLRDLRDTRVKILDFCNSCMNKRRHTREEFDYIIGLCDEYEKYITEANIKNGVISSAIKEIRRIYDRCIQKNGFLKEGEDDG